MPGSPSIVSATGPVGTRSMKRAMTPISPSRPIVSATTRAPSSRRLHAGAIQLGGHTPHIRLGVASHQLRTLSPRLRAAGSSCGHRRMRRRQGRMRDAPDKNRTCARGLGSGGPFAENGCNPQLSQAESASVRQLSRQSVIVPRAQDSAPTPPSQGVTLLCHSVTDMRCRPPPGSNRVSATGGGLVTVPPV